MRYLYLVIPILWVSCGQAPQDPATDKDQTENPSDHVAYQPSQKEVVTEYKKTGRAIALAIDNAKDLPECNNSDDAQLAYVRTEDTFYSCDAENGLWTIVSIKGSKGDTGDQGDIGPQGPAGNSADPLPANEWFDPIGHQYWLIGAIMNPATINFYSSTACSDGWALPTKAQAIAAVQHGLLIASHALDGPAMVWTLEFSSGDPSNRFAIDASAAETEAPLTADAGVICLKQ